jgi:predicted double-glycine peptidase
MNLTMLKVPYYKQDTDFSCGPAVLHMVTVFFGKPRSSRTIQRMVNMDPEHGTSNDDLVGAAGEMDFTVESKNGATMDDLTQYLESGLPVIVNFIEPESDEGHYSLVIGLEGDNIIFNDPLLGAGYRMDIKEFESRWRSGFEDRARWLMVMKPKD